MKTYRVEILGSKFDIIRNEDGEVIARGLFKQDAERIVKLLEKTYHSNL